MKFVVQSGPFKTFRSLADGNCGGICDGNHDDDDQQGRAMLIDDCPKNCPKIGSGNIKKSQGMARYLRALKGSINNDF